MLMEDREFTVEYNKPLFDGVHEIKLHTDRRLPVMHCGQFLHLEVRGCPTILRRPFCLYKFDPQSVTIVVAVVGRGTEVLCKCKPGDRMNAILPIGNGFILAPEHKRIALIGGGVGCEGEPLLVPVREYVLKERYSIHCGKQTQICSAVLGNDAGVIGAALLDE